MNLPLSLNWSAQRQARDFLFGDLDIQLGAVEHGVDVEGFRPVVSRPARDILTPPRGARADVGYLGYELGWDLAHFAMHASSELSVVPPAAAEGWTAGWKHFAERRRVPDSFERKWLRLRCRELVQLRGMQPGVTPDYFRSLTTPYCPVMRSPLSYENGIARLDADKTWTVAPLDKEGGFRTGNLVVMSEQASMALRPYRYDHLRVIAQMASRDPTRSNRGLTAEQWLRLAHLVSLIEPGHRWQELAELPMRAVPPPWLGTAHPFAKLQAILSVMPCTGSKAEGRRAFASLFLGKTQQQLARAVAAAFFAAVGAEQRKGGTRPWAWIAEDAWENEDLQGTWRVLVQSTGDGDLAMLTKRATAVLSDEDFRSAMGGQAGGSTA